ncbi:MAG: isoprenylcysteine carboxylmethyltransferase family protein [Clostridia bacterium]|nr:isoprenylcysteine carboxylmethyltransferase family protein [Clostridia bacterium]
MTVKLFIQALTKFLLGAVLVGLLIFLPAGTVAFWNGWLLMGLLFVPMFAAGLVMMAKNPALLQSRLDAKEKEPEQKTVLLISGVMFIVGFVLCGLNFRFGWLPLPNGVVIAASVVFLLAYVLYAEVLRENTYLSRTIQVQEGQRVVDSGLYGIVRHPMYLATVLLFLSIPLVLGSLVALAVFLVYPFVLVLRIRNEEAVLEAELDGYREYKQRVRYRLIPFVW